MQSESLNRTHRILVGIVVTGAVVIAAIGFAGSYAAVRDLAVKKGFGDFAPFFPIGIDAGIVVLLALDLLLTRIRIPFPLLRQTAWLLTAATIAFNGAAAWPDPLGVGMHAVIPVLFVVSVEAARHAIGRIADITADKHMEGVRLSRWLLAFPSTFRLWRRMKLWELRSYEQVITMEQDRLVYEARLRARYGRGWRRRAPVEAMMPLRLARYGVPLAETGPAGLAAAGIEAPARLTQRTAAGTVRPGHELSRGTEPGRETGAAPEERPPTAGAANPPDDAATPPGPPSPAAPAAPYAAAHTTTDPGRPEWAAPAHDGFPPDTWPDPHAPSPAVAPQRDVPGPAPVPDPTGQDTAVAAHAYAAEDGAHRSQVTVPVVQGGRQRPLGRNGAPDGSRSAYVPDQQQLFVEPEPTPPGPAPEQAYHPPEPPAPEPPPAPVPDPYGADEPVGIPEDIPVEDLYYAAYRQFAAADGNRPTARDLSRTLNDSYAVTNADGSLLSEPYLRRYLPELHERYKAEMGIAG
ncbi:DUF2637 domain-containing protein [Streptomyces sp. TR06-5]|uniref:DUF2637 domain-containing protein n=1 Tax=Streptomyces sp. TR06-5 TaxID=3385976 RepID=UPI0039A2B6E8